MTVLKITAIGNSAGVFLPKEILTKMRVDKGDLLHVGVCQRCCPPISCGVSDLRDADFIFRVEPDGSGGLPVSGFA